jgi:membrane-associated protease RseP (regulator of RpoE activity)
VVFGIFLSIFLYSKRKKLDREGFLFLYRTQWGIKLINYVGTKYKKTLNVLSYVSIVVGYILMATILYLVGKIVYIYIMYPQVVRAIKIPPIMPLVPYLPQMFKLDFLPPFYFTYWIIIIAIIAITHEFSHGIFAKHFGLKIKSTGFGFLGPFLAAFVEPDEKKMAKKDKFSQITVLSAGTFANILTAIIFLIILGGFFYFSFAPAGVVFDTYAYSIVPISGITAINGISVENQNYDLFIKEIENKTGYNITANEKNYLGVEGFFSNSEDYVKLYDDAPAIRSNIIGAITKVNNAEVKSMGDLSTEIKKYSENDKIKITTVTDEETKEYDIILEENQETGEAWIGIGFAKEERSGLMNWLYNKISFFKEKNVYYQPTWQGGVFFYNLLWWIILISVSVALINMLPVGIFDGGRVFYLTLLYFTKKENIVKKIFSGMTYFFLLILAGLMIFWLISFI